MSCVGCGDVTAVMCELAWLLGLMRIHSSRRAIRPEERRPVR